MTPDLDRIIAGLPIDLMMQDGQVQRSYVADTVHNRQLQNYIARHESFALASRRPQAPTGDE